jgi:hypothetical protein
VSYERGLIDRTGPSQFSWARFPKAGDGSKSILIMNVHPSVSVQPPGATIATPFATEAISCPTSEWKRATA